MTGPVNVTPGNYNLNDSAVSEILKDRKTDTKKSTQCSTLYHEFTIFSYNNIIFRVTADKKLKSWIMDRKRS